MPAAENSVSRPRGDAASATVIRIRMLRDGLTTADLAARLGVSRERWTNWLTYGCPAGPFRRRVEAAFDYSLTIWSPVRELKLRRQCRGALGFDPCLLSRPELKRRASALGLTVRRDDGFPCLVNLVLDHLAANPKLFTSQSTP